MTPHCAHCGGTFYFDGDAVRCLSCACLRDPVDPAALPPEISYRRIGQSKRKNVSILAAQIHEVKGR